LSRVFPSVTPIQSLLDGLHIIPRIDSSSHTEFVVVTVTVKTTEKWSSESPAAVSAADVRSNVRTCMASRMYTRSEGDAGDADVDALMARTAVFVRIQVCLPHIGSTAAVEPNHAQQSAIKAPVCYVLDAHTGKPCVIINVTSSNIKALLPQQPSKVGTLFQQLLEQLCLCQDGPTRKQDVALPTAEFPY
jgi:hypothetical protein